MERRQVELPADDATFHPRSKSKLFGLMVLVETAAIRTIVAVVLDATRTPRREHALLPFRGIKQSVCRVEFIAVVNPG
eukprot:4140788-Amphidinium_carterae.2